MIGKIVFLLLCFVVSFLSFEAIAIPSNQMFILRQEKTTLLRKNSELKTENTKLVKVRDKLKIRLNLLGITALASGIGVTATLTTGIVINKNKTKLDTKISSGKESIKKINNNGIDGDIITNDCKYLNQDIWSASMKGDLGIVKSIIQKNKNCVNKIKNDKKQWSPIHFASINGRIEVVKFLIDKKANINAKAKNQWTSLHLASFYFQTKIVKLLVDEGASVNMEVNTWTSLHFASNNGYQQIVELLLNAKANVNAKAIFEKNKHTPLHFASNNGHTKVVEFLLKKNNIEINAKSIHNWTALHFASAKGHLEIIKLLLSKGAKKTNSIYGRAPCDVANNVNMSDFKKKNKIKNLLCD